MKCRACERQTDRELCQYHASAKEKLRAAYPLWVKAYGSMDWNEFLDNVKRDPQTGQWAKEMASVLGESS